MSPGGGRMRVALITGSRSDRGALEMVGQALRPQYDLSWVPVVSGRHADSCADAATIAADGIEYLTATFNSLGSPDLVLIHGDRHEILGAAMAANIMGVPIAH